MGGRQTAPPAAIPAPEGGPTLICPACAPIKHADGTPTEFGKWHGEFPRTFLPLGMFKTNREGNLEHIETGSTKFRDYAIQPDATTPTPCRQTNMANPYDSLKRERVLAEIKAHPGLTLFMLANRLDSHPDAIRSHLYRLNKLKLVHSVNCGEMRVRARRPAHSWFPGPANGDGAAMCRVTSVFQLGQLQASPT